MARRLLPTLCFALALTLPAHGELAGDKRGDEASTLAPVLAPFQHVRFCLRYPAECQPNAARYAVIRPEMMSLLKSVNDRVNQSITPGSKDNYLNLDAGWAISPEIGDCNDYAVTKRHELLMLSLPSSSLRLSVVKTSGGLGHLVLVVTTTAGNMVLDNLAGEILPWQATEYHWLKIQSVDDPRFWVEMKQPIANEIVHHKLNRPI